MIFSCAFIEKEKSISSETSSIKSIKSSDLINVNSPEEAETCQLNTKNDSDIDILDNLKKDNSDYSYSLRESQLLNKDLIQDLNSSKINYSLASAINYEKRVGVSNSSFDKDKLLPNNISQFKDFSEDQLNKGKKLHEIFKNDDNSVISENSSFSKNSYKKEMKNYIAKDFFLKKTHEKNEYNTKKFESNFTKKINPIEYYQGSHSMSVPIKDPNINKEIPKNPSILQYQNSYDKKQVFMENEETRINSVNTNCDISIDRIKKEINENYSNHQKIPFKNEITKEFNNDVNGSLKGSNKNNLYERNLINFQNKNINNNSQILTRQNIPQQNGFTHQPFFNTYYNNNPTNIVRLDPNEIFNNDINFVGNFRKNSENINFMKNNNQGFNHTPQPVNYQDYHKKFQQFNKIGGSKDYRVQKNPEHFNETNNRNNNQQVKNNPKVNYKIDENNASLINNQVKIKSIFDNTINNKIYAEEINRKENSINYNKELNIQNYTQIKSLDTKSQIIDNQLKTLSIAIDDKKISETDKKIHDEEDDDSGENEKLNIIVNKKSSEKVEEIEEKKNKKKKRKKKKKQTLNLEEFTDIQLGEMVLTLAKEQSGCRYLQKKIEESKEFTDNIIFPNVKINIMSLINDSFGNYLIQKTIEHINHKNFSDFIETIAHDFLTIACNSHGTRVLQRLIELLINEVNRIRFLQLITSNFATLLKDPNGNHIIQKYILTFSEKMIEIFTFLNDNFIEVSLGKHGCCVMQRLIEMSEKVQKDNLIQRVIDNCNLLMVDQYGNYVVQYVIMMENCEVNLKITQKFLPEFVNLCQQKYSSNVIEKILEYSDEFVQETLIKEILKGENFRNLLFDSFGNYVIQRSFSVVNNTILYESLKNYFLIHLEELKKFPYGLKLYLRLVNVCPELDDGSEELKQLKISLSSNKLPLKEKSQN